MIIDLKREVHESTDLRQLDALLNVLVGQRCLKVEMSYGDELTLHLGEPAPYTQPHLADETQGAWVVGARASWWSLLLNDPPLLIEANGPGAGQGDRSAGQGTLPEEVEQRATPLIGDRILATRTDLYSLRRPPHVGVALFLDFRGKSRLAIIPNDGPGDEPALPDWEVFTPYRMYLTCGPGAVWSYLRSDVATPDTRSR